MNDEKFDKDIDLHESEWQRTGKREPILGVNGWQFICICIAAYPSYWLVTQLMSLIFD